MRRFRLNGWQRVGIVLSVVWVIVGGTWGWRHANDQTDANFRVCIAAIQTASDLQSCRETRFRALATKGNSAAFVALAPILVVWLLVYALVALVRWIRRGKVLPMLDFDRLNDQLDRAGYDLDKVHELYDLVHAKNEAPPAQTNHPAGRPLGFATGAPNSQNRIGGLVRARAHRRGLGVGFGRRPFMFSGKLCRGSGFSVPLETRMNLASFRAYEWSIKLAPQSAFTRSAIQQSQAAYAGA